MCREEHYKYNIKLALEDHLSLKRMFDFIDPKGI